MKIKSRVYEAITNLKDASDAIRVIRQSREMPIMIRYKITRFIDNLMSEYKHYIETRKEVLEKYGDRNEENELVMQGAEGRQTISITDRENVEALAKELTELGNIDIDIDKFVVALSDLDKVSPPLSGEQLRWLEEIFEYSDIDKAEGEKIKSLAKHKQGRSEQ